MVTAAGDTFFSSLNPVKVLLDELVSTEFVDNFRSTKLDVSFLKNLKSTLLKRQAITTDLAFMHCLAQLRTDAVFELHNLFHQINTEALRCKMEPTEYQTLTPTSQVTKNLSSPCKMFNRVINYKLQRSIEILELLNSSKLGVTMINLSIYWNGTFTTSYNLVDDESSIKLLPLSNSVKVLLDMLVSSVFVDFIRSKMLDDSLVDKLKIRLMRLKAVLNYDMWRKFTNTYINEWFHMLKYDVFEVETLFEEINTKALRCKENQILTSTSPVLISFSSKMQKLIERLEYLSTDGQKGELGVYGYIVDIQFLSLSTSVNVLLDMLDSIEFVDNFQTTKLDVSLLEKMKTPLLVLHHVWGDHMLNVGHWLDILRNTVFEVGYLFEKINLEALRCRVEGNLTNISSPFIWFNGVSNSKFQKLIERLEFFTSRAQGQFGGSSSRSIWNETPASSILDNESSIYGRHTDIKKLKGLLLSSDGDSKIGIISIVGIEGIGKTTLAKILYNDPEVYDNFELKLWEHVSKHFDDLSVLETILHNLNTNKNETSDANNIYPKFLLVLDEVSDARSIRTLLLNFANVAKTGSRIIITTQDERVALSLQTIGISVQTFLYDHYLRPLESEDCWSLLGRHAFGVCNDQQQSNLEEIGREIAKKCYGSPFAAVALGDILRAELSSDYWNFVLESDIWVLTGHDVQPFIRLSYHYLSTPLKRCFAYCSIFPKKSILEKNMVVQLWVAEGLVELSTDQEKVGEEYFDVLLSRSLINRRSIGDVEANFEMHDLVHDLATQVSSPYCIIMDEHNLHDRVHNLSYNRGIYDSYDKFDKLYGLNGLRTFLAIPLQKKQPLCFLSSKVVHHLVPTMKQLRVLSLSNYKSITEVPNSIGDLLYLRYLNLSNTKIERLPTETCKLYNLQFLLLAGCRRLIELPEDIGKLVNLRQLDVSNTAVREMPVQIAKLENLHSLSDFVVSKHNDGLKLAELGKFPHLHGKLSISQLQNVNDPFDADQANMKIKEWISELALEWDCGSTFSDSQIQSVVLEHLRPSTNLKILTIKGYGGINFPNWLGDFFFSNMVYLRISSCNNCLWLPPLGHLGNLKVLIIEGMQSLETIGTEFYGSDNSSFQLFPSLETPHFEEKQEWNWVGGTAAEFPSLKTLSLSMCPKLRVGNISDKFPYLIELQLRECPLLVQSLPSLDHVSNHLMFPLNSLHQLTIDGFPSLTSFPTDALPETLKFLTISNCENLEFLPHEYLHNYTSLEELKISYSCNSMISFTLGALPVLKSLFIEGCKNLKSILIAEGEPGKSLSFLRSIKIWDCNELESFPPAGLATPNLVYIAMWKCEKLRSLPEAMDTLTGLQEMEIDNLPNLQSFAIDDLPISLRELTVGSVGGILSNTIPTWKRLKCLSVLRIKGGDTVNKFMMPFLPASLVTLCICGLSVKGIDGKWLKHLTSLQNLEIVNAPKLKLLPKKGLPSSLLVLSMTHCPLLEASLRRKQGKEWRKICHIPSIIIDDELIT